MQDLVRLELDVPAAMIPWLQGCDLFGNGVEETALFFLREGIERHRAAMWNRGVFGGRKAHSAILAAVKAFHAEPVNCGPGAAEAKAFKTTLAEIHGAAP